MNIGLYLSKYIQNDPPKTKSLFGAALHAGEIVAIIPQGLRCSSSFGAVSFSVLPTWLYLQRPSCSPSTVLMRFSHMKPSCAAACYDFANLDAGSIYMQIIFLRWIELRVLPPSRENHKMHACCSDRRSEFGSIKTRTKITERSAPIASLLSGIRG